MNKKAGPGRPRTEFTTPFGRWLVHKDISTLEAADALDRTDSTIYGLASGRFNPGRELGWRIEEWTKGDIPFDRETWPSCEGA